MGREQRRDSNRARPGGVPPAAPPQRVRVPVNRHDWDKMSFLHWPVAPATLAPLVPEALDLLTYEAAAWVSVTPFYIRVRPPLLPAVPGVTTFPETNVRTYVAGPDGREGLWFLRMEVTRTWFVAALRAVGLPYVRQRMTVDAGTRIAYTSGPRASDRAGSRVVVRPGARLTPSTGGPRERFLTSRWGAYHRQGTLLLYTPVDHPPWSLHVAELESCDVGPLFESSGLPVPRDRPLTQFSPGVTAKIGRPQLVAR